MAEKRKGTKSVPNTNHGNKLDRPQGGGKVQNVKGGKKRH